MVSTTRAEFRFSAFRRSKERLLVPGGADFEHLRWGREIVRQEAAALGQLSNRLDETFTRSGGRYSRLPWKHRGFGDG